MNQQPQPTPSQASQKSAAEHISEAHTLLQTLRGRLDRHPELEDAIRSLELALSQLTTSTGGML